jgi:hypothetical protein
LNRRAAAVNKNNHKRRPAGQDYATRTKGLQRKVFLRAAKKIAKHFKPSC